MVDHDPRDERDYSRNPLPYTGKHRNYPIRSSPYASFAPGVSGVVLLVAVAGLALVLFSKGFNGRTTTLFLLGSGIFLVAYYFESRSQNQAPGRLERISALLWRAFRTVVGLVGALVLIGGPAVGLVQDAQLLHSFKGASIFGLSILMGLGCAWWGIIGNAWGYSLRDDLRLYREKKRRYGWPF